MTKISCPFCNKVGITMVILGLTLVVAGTTLTLPGLALIGLITLLSAYIVPNMVSKDSCHGSHCSSTAHESGEEPPDE